MSAIFRITQDSVAGSWGVARRDIQLSSSGGPITFEAQATGVTYSWELISEPEGSSGIIVSPTSQSATLELSVRGGYIVRLTVDAGLITEDVSELYLGIPLPTSGLCLPAFNETIQDNSQGTDYYGYERKYTAFSKWLDANVGSVGTFEAGSGTLSALRTGTTNTVSGDYSFAVGQGNTVTAAYSAVSGLNHTIAGSMNQVSGYDIASAGGDYNILGGISHNLVDDSDANIIGGYGVTGKIAYSIVGGESHSFATTGNNLGNIICGSNGTYGEGLHHNLIVGSLLSIGDNARYNLIGGLQGGGSTGDGCEHIVSWGDSLTVDAGVQYSSIFGSANRIGGSFSLVGGSGNILLGNYNYGLGRNNEVAAGCSYNFLFGYNGEISSAGSDAHNNFIIGAGNHLTGSGQYNFIGGDSIVLAQGSHNFIFGSTLTTGTGLYENAIFGTIHTINNNTDYSLVVGTSHVVSTSYSAILGSSNTLAADYSLITGRNNSITAGDSSVVLGYSNTTTSGASLSQSLLLGNTNNIDTNFAQNSIIAGIQHDLTTVYNSFVIGQNNSNAATSSQIANSIIVGRNLAVANNNSIDYSVIGGYGNSISGSTSSIIIGQSISQTTGTYLSYSAIFGDSHTFVDNVGCIVSGRYNLLGVNSNYHAVFGQSNEVIDGHTHSLIAGTQNKFGLMNSGTTISFSIAGSTVTLTDSSNPFPAEMGHFTSEIVITGATSAGNNGTFNATCTSSSTVTYTNASGVTEAGVVATKWIIRTASATGVSGYTAIVGAQNNAYAGGSNFIAGYGNTVFGAIASAAIGFENSIYVGSNYSNLFGYQNSLAAGGSGTLISGISNSLDAGCSWSIVAGKAIVAGGGCNGNAFFGENHNIGGGSGYNLIVGYDNDLQSGSHNVIGGNNNDLGGGCNYNAMFGKDNGIAVGTGGAVYNLIGGTRNTLGPSCIANIVGGMRNDLDTTGIGNTSYDIVGGMNNTLLNNVVYSLVIGNNNYVDSPDNVLIAGKYNHANTKANYALFGYGARGYFDNAIFVGGGHPTSAMSDYTDSGNGQSIIGIAHSRQTTDATPVTLYLNGAQASSEIVTIDDHAYTVQAIVTAKCLTGDSAGGTKHWRVTASLDNASGTLTLIDYTVDILGTTSISHESDWDVIPIVYSTNKFSFQVTGHTNDSSIVWQVNSMMSEAGV